MSTRSTACAIAVGILLACAGAPSIADEKEDDARIDALSSLKDDLLNEGISRLTTANTGASTDLQGLATSLNDLIPDLKISLNGDDVESDSLNSLGFTYSPRIDKVADVGISILVDTPEIYPLFEEQGLLTAEQAAALGNSLTLGDSTKISLTVSRLGKFLGTRYGRSLADYQDAMESMLGIAQDAAAAEKVRIVQLQDEQGQINFSLRDACPTVRTDVQTVLENKSNTRQQVDAELQRSIGKALAENPAINADSCESQASRFIDLHFELEQRLSRYVTSLESSLKRMGLFALPELVEQQPQLQLTASYTDKEELAGPDELSLAVSWEIPLGANRVDQFLLSDAWQRCSQRVQETALSCVDALSGTLGDSMLSSQPTKSQFRFSLSGEYTRQDDYSVALTDPMLDFSLGKESTTSIAASLYWKRYMNDFDNEPYVFEGTFEYQSNDSDVRNDRALLGLTASRNISSGLALSLGIVWANRPEFRGDVDQELSAKLGLNYKLSPR